MLFNTFHALWTDSSHQNRQTPAKDRRQACQIVSGEGERGLGAYLRQADEARLAQSADGFAPAEDFFDQLAFLEAHRVAVVTRGAPIDGAVFFLGHVRRHAQVVQLLDERGRVVALSAPSVAPALLMLRPAMISAASRSAVPLASVVALTTRPLRFSISAWPR